MALNDLTSPEAVERALDEFDEIGREAFLNKYRFGHARRYFVRRNGKYYDSKAIAGAAMGFQDPQRGPCVRTSSPVESKAQRRSSNNLASTLCRVRRSLGRFSTIGRARSPRLTSSSSRAR
jgi:hypothetical protein